MVAKAKRLPLVCALILGFCCSGSRPLYSSRWPPVSGSTMCKKAAPGFCAICCRSRYWSVLPNFHQWNGNRCLIGLFLMNFPGKFALERHLVRQRPVWNALNWIRRRGGRLPLIEVRGPSRGPDVS